MCEKCCKLILKFLYLHINKKGKLKITLTNTIINIMNYLDQLSLKVQNEIMRKFKKEELQEMLAACPQFCLKKRGAREMLGVAAKVVLIDWALEFGLIKIKVIKPVPSRKSK